MRPTRQPMQGTVELRSGKWQWTLYPERDGCRVFFHHHQRRNEKMVSWFPGTEVTPEGVREAAAQPLDRTWVCPDGLLWKAALELPSVTARARNPEGLLLVFSRAVVRREVLVPTTTELGELTAGELAELLGKSQ